MPIYGSNNRILATSSNSSEAELPRALTEEVMLQLQQDRHCMKAVWSHCESVVQLLVGSGGERVTLSHTACTDMLAHVSYNSVGQGQ